jgi:hypothetical protein
MRVGSLITAFAKAAVIPHYRRKLRRFEASLPKAHEIQRHALFEKIRRCQESRFGRDHGFAGIQTLADYRRQVPILRYEDLAPYIEDVSRGQIDALFPTGEKVLMFGTSTGTTGRPKLNPITQTWLREYRATLEAWGVKAIVEHAEMIGTKILQISGPADLGRSPTGLDIGMVSALSFRYQNRVFRSFYAIPGDICNVADPEAKYYLMLRLALTKPVGWMVTVTPANLLRVAQVGQEQKEHLIRDLYDGTLREGIEVPEPLRHRLARVLRARLRKRARELERIINRTGTFYPKDYWPLSLICCWLGGTVGFRARDLSTYYGDVPRRDVGLVSTEGHHTIPLCDGSPEGVLAISGNYYEFVPVDEMQSDRPTALECHELEPGREYFVLVTTSSGLYRYDLGDVVRCTGYVGQAPLLEFLHKGLHYSDLEGEKVSEYQVVQAVTTASHELGLRLDYFTAVPVRPEREPPYYALLVEDPAIGEGTAGRFLEIIDRELVRQNVMYAGKRSDRYVGAPRLLRLAPGTWSEFTHAQAQRRGTGDSQYKHPALVPDPEFLNRFQAIDTMTARAKPA